MSDLLRKHIVFRGWVQGVGFRYRAWHAAELYSCTGWIRNDADGSVEMEIQGTEEGIDQVIAAVSRGFFITIEEMEVRRIPVIEERDFYVRD